MDPKNLRQEEINKFEMTGMEHLLFMDAILLYSEYY